MGKTMGSKSKDTLPTEFFYSMVWSYMLLLVSKRLKK